jgi:hypothetical protein
MKIHKRTLFIAALAAFIVTAEQPASAENVYTPPFTLEKREAVQYVDREGDPSIGGDHPH